MNLDEIRGGARKKLIEEDEQLRSMQTSDEKDLPPQYYALKAEKEN